MFIPSFIAFCLAGSALAGSYQRFDGLTVQLTGPPSTVSSISDLKFTATVRNNGIESVKILKYATILDDKLPTRSFNIMKGGDILTFSGVKLSVSLDDLDDTSFVVILAGKSVTVNHDVASLFDFATAGTGTYSFDPITDFKIMAAGERFKGVESFSKIKVQSNRMMVAVTHDIAQREIPELNKRAVNICTNSSRKAFIDASYTEGKALASGGVSFIKANSTSALYRAYWGNTTTSKVISVLNAVANETSRSRTLSCVDSFGVCSGGVIAYTVTATTNIYYCGLFFNEVPTANLCRGTTVASRNVRGGTTLHELTHAVSDTDDVTYGCAADQALSDAQSVINADNYNCFTTQVYANTRCGH